MGIIAASANRAHPVIPYPVMVAGIDLALYRGQVVIVGLRAECSALSRGWFTNGDWLVTPRGGVTLSF